MSVCGRQWSRGRVCVAAFSGCSKSPFVTEEHREGKDGEQQKKDWKKGWGATDKGRERGGGPLRKLNPSAWTFSSPGSNNIFHLCMHECVYKLSSVCLNVWMSLSQSIYECVLIVRHEHKEHTSHRESPGSRCERDDPLHSFPRQDGPQGNRCIPHVIQIC